MKETKFKQTLVQTKEGSRHCEEHSDMAIQGGFKMTEVGMIPSDWEVKKLSSVCTIIMGQSPDSKYYNEKEGIPLIQGNADIENRETFVRFYTTQITKKGLKGDKILTVRAPVGSVAKATFDCCLGRGVCALRDANDFLYQYLIYIEKEWARRSAGSTFDSIKSDELCATLVMVPPSKAEQTAIANALSDVDTLINNLEKLIAKKKNIKQGAMQQLLTGKKRLPGFAPAKPTYKQTELGIIPSDWEVKKIGEFTKLQAGGTPSTLCDEFWGGNIRWMNSGELNNKRIYDVAGRITKLGLNSSSTHLIPSNCVLVGLAGQGKTRGTAAINYVELCTNQSIAAMFPSKTHNSEYLYHNIDSRYEELRELSSGDGGRGGLNLGILANLFIALPSKAEQTAIANVLSDMDSEISALETKLAKYRTLKTGMMQQLLTGKIRLV